MLHKKLILGEEVVSEIPKIFQLLHQTLLQTNEHEGTQFEKIDSKSI